MTDGLYTGGDWIFKGQVNGRYTVGIDQPKYYNWSGFWPSSSVSWGSLDSKAKLLIPLELC